MTTVGHNLAIDRLRAFVERIERLEEEKAALAADIREIYKEAKGDGFSPQVLRIVVQRRRMDKAEREERDALVELYEGGAGRVSRKSDYPAVEHEWYQEPAWASELLFDAEQFLYRGEPALIWDPAAGAGTIVDVARLHGNYEARGSDIIVRRQDIWQMDFLTARLHDDFADGRIRLVSNPPYSLAQQFIERAIALGVPKHAWLLQRDFPYSQKRYVLFSRHPPARIWFLSSRPSCPPGELLARGEIEQSGGSVDYLWMVWDREHRGPTQAGWLIRPEHAA